MGVLRFRYHAKLWHLGKRLSETKHKWGAFVRDTGLLLAEKYGCNAVEIWLYVTLLVLLHPTVLHSQARATEGSFQLLPLLVELPAMSNCITLLYVYCVLGGDTKVMLLVLLARKLQTKLFPYRNYVIIVVIGQPHGDMLLKRAPKHLFGSNLEK